MGNDFNEYYLAHHGIKGQKWGVRRYQNKDRSLTPAGEKRYNNNNGDAPYSKTARKVYSSMSSKSRSRMMKTGKAIMDARSKVIKGAKAAGRNLKMTGKAISKFAKGELRRPSNKKVGEINSGVKSRKVSTTSNKSSKNRSRTQRMGNAILKYGKSARAALKRGGQAVVLATKPSTYKTAAKLAKQRAERRKKRR